MLLGIFKIWNPSTFPPKIYKTRLRQSCPPFPHNCNRWLTWFISVILEYKLQILWENAKLKNVDMKDIRYIIYVNNHFVVILVEKQLYRLRLETSDFIFPKKHVISHTIRVLYYRMFKHVGGTLNLDSHQFWFSRAIFYEEKRDWDWWTNIRNYVLGVYNSGYQSSY